MYTYKYVYIIYAYIYICIYSNYNSLMKQCFAPLLLLACICILYIRFVCVRLLDVINILRIRKFKGIIMKKDVCVPLYVSNNNIFLPSS